MTLTSPLAWRSSTEVETSAAGKPRAVDPGLVREAAVQVFLGIRVPDRYVDGIAAAERLADARERRSIERFRRRRA